MSECEKCIRAQDERDPLNAASRARMRAWWKVLAPTLPAWTLPDDGPRQVCIDCPACGGHWLVNEGDEWCWKCTWELGQIEKHSGAPIETGFKVGDRVRWGFSEGPVRYVDPSGFIEILSGGWTIRIEHDNLHQVVLVERGGSAA